MNSCDVKLDLAPALLSANGVVEKYTLVPGIGIPFPTDADPRDDVVLGDTDDDGDCSPPLPGCGLSFFIFGNFGIVIVIWADKDIVGTKTIPNIPMVQKSFATATFIEFFSSRLRTPESHLLTRARFN